MGRPSGALLAIGRLNLGDQLRRKPHELLKRFQDTLTLNAHEGLPPVPSSSGAPTNSCDMNPFKCCNLLHTCNIYKYKYLYISTRFHIVIYCICLLYHSSAKISSILSWCWFPAASKSRSMRGRPCTMSEVLGTTCGSVAMVSPICTTLPLFTSKAT